MKKEVAPARLSKAELEEAASGMLRVADTVNQGALPKVVVQKSTMPGLLSDREIEAAAAGELKYAETRTPDQVPTDVRIEHKPLSGSKWRERMLDLLRKGTVEQVQNGLEPIKPLDTMKIKIYDHKIIESKIYNYYIKTNFGLTSDAESMIERVLRQKLCDQKNKLGDKKNNLKGEEGEKK